MCSLRAGMSGWTDILSAGLTSAGNIITSINSGGSSQQSAASIQAAILKAQADQRAADQAAVAAAAAATPASATSIFSGVTPAMWAICAASGMALIVAVVKN